MSKRFLICILGALALGGLLPGICWAGLTYDGSTTIGENIMPEAVKAFEAKTGVKFDKVEPLTINGFDAAVGRSTLTVLEKRVDLRMLAIQLKDGTMFRFTLLCPADKAASLDAAFQRIVASFHAIQAGETDGYRPSRLAVVVPGAGDTVEGLAARMAFADFREERFRVLNGLAEAEALAPGRPVKLVVE